MIASALRYGTTRHLHPGARFNSDAKSFDMQSINWKEGNDAHNLEELLQWSYNYHTREYPEIMNYGFDFESNKWTNEQGVHLRDESVERLFDVTSGGIASKIGKRTLKRAVVNNSLLQATRKTSRGTGRNRRYLLEDLIRWSVQQLPTELEAIQYSTEKARDQIGLFRKPLTTSDIRTIVSRISGKWQGVPAIEVIETTRELPGAIKKDALRSGMALSSVNGVYMDGKAYLIADALHSPSDVEAVLLHEVLGHAGVAKVFGRDLHIELNKLWLKLGGKKGVTALGKRYQIGFE